MKLRCGRKRSETNREMRKCGEACEPLMLAGAEKTAHAAAGGAEASVSGYEDVWLKLTENYLSNDTVILGLYSKQTQHSASGFYIICMHAQ